jgi:hypothetical protein
MRVPNSCTALRAHSTNSATLPGCSKPPRSSNHCGGGGGGGPTRLRGWWRCAHAACVDAGVCATSPWCVYSWRGLRARTALAQQTHTHLRVCEVVQRGVGLDARCLHGVQHVMVPAAGRRMLVGRWWVSAAIVQHLTPSQVPQRPQPSASQHPTPSSHLPKKTHPHTEIRTAALLRRRSRRASARCVPTRWRSEARCSPPPWPGECPPRTCMWRLTVCLTARLTTPSSTCKGVGRSVVQQRHQRPQAARRQQSGCWQRGCGTVTASKVSGVHQSLPDSCREWRHCQCADDSAR